MATKRNQPQYLSQRQQFNFDAGEDFINSLPDNSNQKKKEEPGNFARGFKKSMYQIPQTIGGTIGLAGDVLGADGMRDYGMGIYENNTKKVEELTRDSDSISNVMEGNGSFGDWLSSGAGYVGGQALSALATGGVGALVGKQLASRGVRHMLESQLEKEAAKQAISKGAKVGAASAAFGSNLVQEAGSIYPEALQEAQKNGVELTAGDKARIIGSSLAAAGVDTLGEALIANKFLGGGRRAITNSAGEQVSESVGRAALREVPLGMAKEAGTEGVQTAIERYGANQDLSSKEAIRDYVDSAALGALGGAGGGVASSFTKQRILETGPLTRSLNAGIDVENATLQTSPQNPATQNIDPQNPAPQPSANLPATQNNPAQQFTGMDELISAVQNEDNPSLVREITQRQAQQQMDQPSQIEGGPTNFDELLQQSNQQREQERIETRESWEGAKEQAAIDLAEQDRLEQENRLRLPAPDMPMPEGALIDDNGTLRPQTYQDAAAAQVAAAQREELGQPVPYGERGGIENVSVPSSPSVPEEPAYILHPSGKPFTNKIGAQSRLKQLGGNHTIVPYEGGFAIRNNDPQAVTQVQEQQAASGVPDATAGSAQPDPVAIQPGDIMHPSGKPFANKYPAVMTQRQSGGEIIKVDGGYIVRPPKQASLEEIVAESQSEPTYEKGKTGAETARNKLDAENPFLSFLGKYGLNIEERSDVGGERGKARLIPGHGPLFRKNGLRLDELAQVAKEAGFLSQEQIDSDTDNGGVNALSDMIGQALNNEVIPKVQSEPEVNPDVEMLNEAKNLGLETTGKTPDQVYDMIKAVHDQKYDSQQEQEWNTAVELFNDLSLEAQELAREYNLHELYFDIEELENAKTNDTGSQGQASEPVTGGAIQTEEVNRGDNETSTKQAEGVDAAEAGRKEGLEPELVQQESAKQAAEDDNGVTVRAGKGLISDKFLSEIDGDVVPGGPFETEDQARTAAIEWKNTKIRAGENDKAERERRDKLADKVKAGSQLSSDELKSIGFREGYSDMRWFIGAAADLFGISSRSIRSNVSSLIKDAYTDMGAKRELVPTNKALQAVSNSLTKTVDSISDFGEKIGGAKKDVWSGFKDKMDAAKDLDIAAEPLSKSWPEPDYQGLLDNGADSWAVGFMHAARDAVPRKPTKSYKLKSWAAGVETLRNFAAEIADGTVSTEKVKTEMRKLAGSYSPFHFDDLLNRIELYQAVGHSKSLADVRIGYGEYAMLNGVEYKPSKVIWTVEKKAAASAFSNFPRQLAQGSTKQAAIDDFKAKFSAMEITKPANKEVTFDVFSERGKPGFFVGKKVGRNFITLAGPFDTVKEARAHRNDNQDQLVTKLEKAKEIPNERRDTNNPRVGEDMREGRNVTPEMFSNAFGFRGVEFGNYVEQSKRQADLNEAYDALMDMAALLGIPPKSISLNGTLGLAFGARGSGGKQAAAAHYESNKVVINLTKKSGAGSLGHEWWHALDNYFSRMAQKPGSFMTERLDVNLSGKGSNYIYRDEGVRKEMIDAFGAVMKSIRSTAIKARSLKLDGKRTKEYWTTDVEMSARAFESYLISKLQDNNASNDYLANIVGADTWAAAEKIGFELDDSYPYPTAGEIPAIRAGFDHLFSVIESKETDQGTALFSREDGRRSKFGFDVDELQPIVDQISSTWKNAPKINIVQTIDDLPFDAPSDARGAYFKKQVYLVAANLRDQAQAEAVLLHETLGHAGLNELFGDKLAPALRSIAMKNRKIAEAAAVWRKGNTDIKGKMSDERYHLVSIEEALADYVGTGRTINGVEKLLAAIQKGLRTIGLNSVADWMENATDAEVLAMLASARNYIEKGSEFSVFGEQQAQAFSRDEKNALSTDTKIEEGNPKALFSRSVITGDNNRTRTPEQLRAFENVGRTVEVPTLKERFNKLTENLGKKLAQGIVDQFAPIKDLSVEAYGLMRLSKGASGAFEAMLKGGQLKLSDGVYDFDETKRGGVVDRLLVPLQGESDDFMWWVAGNRAESLTTQGKEHLFTTDDIKAFKSLSDGQASFDYTIQHGLQKGKTTRDRATIYADSLKTFNEFNKNTLDMAEQSGLIDPDSRKIWESEFYIPFYRVSEESDDGVRGMNVKSGVVRQQAFKKLKGGTDKLNSDLLENTLMNWAHLLDASAKNRAAKSTLEAAENVGAAMPAMSGDKKTVWYMDNGEKKYFTVEDVHLLAAIQGLEYAGMRNAAMDGMTKMKHIVTMSITASPFFKTKNLIRDSISAIALADINYNPVTNIKEGWKLTDPKSDDYFRMLAGGGTIHFGSMLEGNESKRIRKLIDSGVDESTILKGWDSVASKFGKVWDAYNELGNRGETINRASLYNQLIKKGVSHAEASLQARDMMDFSMQGSWTIIRALTQVVPFMNARLQGLYKLGKSAKEDPKRFGTVLGAVAMSSIALMLAYADDDDWKKREDWDRDTFWWFKFGGTAFRIPKPFEIGAIGTLAERGIEYFTQDEMTGERFIKRFKTLLLDNLSMNPTPQLFKPIIDIYANKDSFTDRPIESMSMERLQSDYRFNGTTSMPARAISTTGNAISGNHFLSPVQVDHLIRGYFGWLGTAVVGTADRIVSLVDNEPARATIDRAKWLTGGMVSDLSSAQSRYVTQMYEQAKVLDEAYGTWRMLIKTGKVEEAKEFAEDNADKLRRYKGLQNVKKQATSLNEQTRVIERSNLDADEKRDKINLIQQRKDNIARRVSL